MRPFEWALIQSDLCLYKKSRSEHIQRHQGLRCPEGWPCEEAARGRPPLAKERGLRGSQPCWHLDLELPASRPTNFCCLCHPVCGLLIGSCSKLTQSWIRKFSLWFYRNLTWPIRTLTKPTFPRSPLSLPWCLSFSVFQPLWPSASFFTRSVPNA